MSAEAVDPRIRGWVASEVTYLEMTATPERPAAAAPAGVEVHRAVWPTLSFYRYLYDTIGADWTWTARRLLDDKSLAAQIRDSMVEVNVIWVEGVPAGLIEIDRRSKLEIELLYFGLIPDFVGRGLGRFALDWAVDRAWSFRPKRCWLHTCDLDHPNALPTYLKAGFAPFDRRQGREAILHGMTPPRRNGAFVSADEFIAPENAP